MTMLSLSLGSKIGLINKLLSYDEPKSIKEIANDADLKERFGQVYFTLADPKGGGAPGMRTPLNPISFMFMQFSGKNGQIIGWCSHLWGLAPPSGKSWTESG